MTPEEIRAFWETYERTMRLGEQRKGQALMNALAVVAMPLYDMITGTVADCFYRDDRIPAFFEELGI